MKKDNLWCLLIGHKLRELKDEKTIWCDRCNKKIVVVKKGFGYAGINMIKRKEPKIIFNSLKLIGMLLIMLYVIGVIRFGF